MFSNELKNLPVDSIIEAQSDEVDVDLNIQDDSIAQEVLKKFKAQYPNLTHVQILPYVRQLKEKEN